MVRDREPNASQLFPYQEFSTRLQRVHAESSAISNQVLLAFDLLLSDCTYGKHSQRSPKSDRHRDCAEEHGQWMLQSLRNRHNVRHRGQRLRAVKVEQYGDKEFSQIYAI
jgi:hypothetical protein